MLPRRCNQQRKIRQYHQRVQQLCQRPAAAQKGDFIGEKLGNAGIGNGYMFAQGEDATNIPTTGTAHYSGNAVHASNGALERGTVALAVDFSSRTINGQVSLPGRGNVASLNGVFEGPSGFKNDPANPPAAAKFNGSFYGPQAAELGGVYYKDGVNGYSGAFGAQKQ